MKAHYGANESRRLLEDEGSGVVDVRLVDLEVIKKYSLAVRRDTVPAEELLTALDASREIVLAALGDPQPGPRGGSGPSRATPALPATRSPRRPRTPGASAPPAGQRPKAQTPKAQSPNAQTPNAQTSAGETPGDQPTKGSRSAPAAAALPRRSPPRRRGGPAGEA